MKNDAICSGGGRGTVPTWTAMLGVVQQVMNGLMKPMGCSFRSLATVWSDRRGGADVLDAGPARPALQTRPSCNLEGGAHPGAGRDGGDRAPGALRGRRRLFGVPTLDSPSFVAVATLVRTLGIVTARRLMNVVKRRNDLAEVDAILDLTRDPAAFLRSSGLEADAREPRGRACDSSIRSHASPAEGSRRSVATRTTHDSAVPTSCSRRKRVPARRRGLLRRARRPRHSVRDVVEEFHREEIDRRARLPYRVATADRTSWRCRDQRRLQASSSRRISDRRSHGCPHGRSDPSWSRARRP